MNGGQAACLVPVVGFWPSCAVQAIELPDLDSGRHVSPGPFADVGARRGSERVARWSKAECVHGACLESTSLPPLQRRSALIAKTTAHLGPSFNVVRYQVL